MCAGIEGGRGGLLLTPRVAAAVCLANRRSRVRAAAAYNLGAVDEALASMGANLLVVDPQAASVFEMKQMARRLATSEPGCAREFVEQFESG